MAFEKYEDMRVGDVIECYRVEEIARTLSDRERRATTLSALRNISVVIAGLDPSDRIPKALNTSWTSCCGMDARAKPGHDGKFASDYSEAWPRFENSDRSGQPSQRQLRVGELVRHALAEVFAARRGGPEFDGVLVSIAEVRMSADLKHATVLVAPLARARPDDGRRDAEPQRARLRGKHRAGAAPDAPCRT